MVLDVTSRLRVSVPTVVCVSVLVAVVLCVSVALVVVETLLVVVGASDTDSDGEGRVVSDVELVPVHFGVRVPLVEVVGVSTISSVREGVVEGVAVVDLEINSVMESSTLFEFVTSNIVRHKTYPRSNWVRNIVVYEHSDKQIYRNTKCNDHATTNEDTLPIVHEYLARQHHCDGLYYPSAYKDKLPLHRSDTNGTIVHDADSDFDEDCSTVIVRFLEQYSHVHSDDVDVE